VISSLSKELNQAVENWRQRDLSSEEIKYMFMDGGNFNMRLDDSIEMVPVLVAIGVTEAGHSG
jgi:putative transposase